MRCEDRQVEQATDRIDAMQCDAMNQMVRLDAAIQETYLLDMNCQGVD